MVSKSLHVALLRGINVGGNNKLPMKDLVKHFQKVGCTDVSTYFASGNVIFGATAPVLKKVAGDVTALILKHQKLSVPIVLRSAEELHDVVEANPYASEPNDRVYVTFLADAPTRAQIAKLDPASYAPDRFSVNGREVYLQLPQGAAKTKLGTALFDRVFSTVSTARNWRTTVKLAELSAG